MASLLQLVEALVSDPEAKADYGRDPDGYLSQRGFGDLDANDVTEALGHAADSFPPALASQVQPDEGFAALTSIELDDLGMSGVEDYSSSAPTPTDSGPFSDWDDDGVKEWNSSPDIADWELDPPATAAAEVLEPSQDVDDDLQFAPNEPSHVSPTSHLFADPSELDTPLALDQADAAATAPDVATAETPTTTEEVVEHEVVEHEVVEHEVVEHEPLLVEPEHFVTGAFELPADDPWLPNTSETDDSFADDVTDDWDDDVDGNVIGDAFGL